MYTYKTRITFRDSDAAGVLFFARYYALAHDAYEALLIDAGVNIGQMLFTSDYVFPIVHTESDHLNPLLVGEDITIHIKVAELKRRTYTLAYKFTNSKGDTACKIKTVHCAVDKQKRKAVPLPDVMTEALRLYTDDTKK